MARKKAKFEDLIGKTFGEWFVLKHLGKGQWLCRCKCGCTKKVSGGNLRYGKSTQCRSCIDLQRILPDGEAAFNGLYKSYKRGARVRNIEWSLTKEQVKVLTKLPCHYTGLPPSSIHKVGNVSKYMFNGIDRLDNTKGYTFENCVPCCGKVNEMKMDSSHDELLHYCRLVVNHAQKRTAA